MRLAVIVPVSPYESSEIILRSIQHIKSLEYGDLEIKIVYVIDTNGKNDPRIKVAENAGIEVLKRESTRGRRGGGWGFHKRLMDMGLTPGTKITVVKSAPFRGPIEVYVRGSRLALGRGMAARIFVEIDK